MQMTQFIIVTYLKHSVTICWSFSLKARSIWFAFCKWGFNSYCTWN